MDRWTRFRACAVLAVVVGLTATLAGCDPSDEQVVVVNDCGATLTVAIAGSSIPIPDEYARKDAEERGDLVAPGASVSASFMYSMGGVVIEALAADGSVASLWRNFDDPERSFALSPATGTCPQ